MIEIKKLDWDSDFFDLKIASVKCLQNIELSQTEIEAIESSNSDLVYFFSNEFDHEFNASIESLGARLVDKKVTYLKTISKNLDELDYSSIHLYEGIITDKLYQLSIDAGIYSRYFLDVKIPRFKAEQMYKIWIERSVKKEIADGAFCYSEPKIPTDIGGFVTIKTHSDKTNIGLFSVDSTVRRSGIGRKLMAFSEAYTLNNNLNQIDVVTQLDNKVACQFYESCGFKISKIEYVYHLWKK
jgi:dTDP-4-amino-4,6-dideoxy-D-galactose acyltransferase